MQYRELMDGDFFVIAFHGQSDLNSENYPKIKHEDHYRDLFSLIPHTSPGDDWEVKRISLEEAKEKLKELGFADEKIAERLNEADCV